MKKFLFITLRHLKYQFLSDCRKVIGKPKLFHPLLMKGEGTIQFGNDVQIGVVSSPFFYSHYLIIIYAASLTYFQYLSSFGFTLPYYIALLTY